jgi:hypothetical protein
MATILSKPVRRQTPWPAPHGVAPQVVITLYPGGVIGLREIRRRREVQLSASMLYTQALLKEAREKRQQQRRRRKP